MAKLKKYKILLGGKAFFIEARTEAGARRRAARILGTEIKVKQVGK